MDIVELKRELLSALNREARESCQYHLGDVVVFNQPPERRFTFSFISARWPSRFGMYGIQDEYIIRNNETGCLRIAFSDHVITKLLALPRGQ